MSINVAIDGPAGAGKSTIAKAAAKQLGYIYVDTGALYRSIAYYALSKGISADDTEGVVSLLSEIKPELRYIDGTQHVFVNGEDVSDFIRTPQVSMGASKVSAIPAVRDFLFNLQKDIAAENNVIMDGRDIGTVVLPHAQVKVYLTASDEVRADRRFKELAEKGQPAVYEDVLSEIRQRDYNDMHREIAPLKRADDAVLLDTSDNTPEEAVERLIELIKSKI